MTAASYKKATGVDQNGKIAFREKYGYIHSTASSNKWFELSGPHWDGHKYYVAAPFENDAWSTLNYISFFDTDCDLDAGYCGNENANSQGAGYRPVVKLVQGVSITVRNGIYSVK